MFLPAVSYPNLKKKMLINLNQIATVYEGTPESTYIRVVGKADPIEVEGSYTRIVAQIKSVMGDYE